MKANRLLQSGLVAVVALLLASCFDSTVPLSDPSKSKPDERLAGTWRSRNDDGSVSEYHFAQAGGQLPASVTRVTGNTRKPDGTTEQMEPLLAFPTTISGKTYLNVCDGKEQQIKLLTDKGWTGGTVHEYLIFRYQITGDTLTVRWMDSDVKKRAIEAGTIKGKLEKDKDGNARAYFTDTPENLTKFIAEAGDNLFPGDGMRLEKVK